jgi:hypothetical protein
MWRLQIKLRARLERRATPARAERARHAACGYEAAWPPPWPAPPTERSIYATPIEKSES